jgi:hypothetical protein
LSAVVEAIDPGADAVRDGVSISEDRQYHVRQLTAIQLWLE